MRRPTRGRTKRGRNRKNARYSGSALFLSVIYVLLYTVGASSSQEVIYKAPKGKRELFSHEEIKDISVTPAEKSKTEYVYDPTGKTDPFKSFIAKQEVVKEKERTKPKTYLETLDLSQLELIGIILNPKGSWAMVRDAKGLGYVIRKGTPIGLNGGVVHKIGEKEVIIREKYRDFRGQVRVKNIAKKLHPEG